MSLKIESNIDVEPCIPFGVTIAACESIRPITTQPRVVFPGRQVDIDKEALGLEGTTKYILERILESATILVHDRKIIIERY